MEILTNIDDVSVRQKYLSILAIEIYKSLMKINPDFAWDFYTKKPVTYHSHSGKNLYFPKSNTTRYGLNSLLLGRKFFMKKSFNFRKELPKV